VPESAGALDAPAFDAPYVEPGEEKLKIVSALLAALETGLVSDASDRLGSPNIGFQKKEPRPEYPPDGAEQVEATNYAKPPGQASM
jgi:hypothetical protein